MGYLPDPDERGRQLGIGVPVRVRSSGASGVIVEQPDADTFRVLVRLGGAEVEAERADVRHDTWQSAFAREFWLGVVADPSGWLISEE
jgi:hypothetical protein